MILLYYFGVGTILQTILHLKNLNKNNGKNYHRYISQCEGREFDPPRLHHYLKARRALALSLYGLIPEFAGLFPALRIQGEHRSVHFHPAAPLNSSLFSVCAKVVLRMLEAFLEGRRGMVCAVFHLPVERRHELTQWRRRGIPEIDDVSSLRKFAHADLCQARGNQR